MWLSLTGSACAKTATNTQNHPCILVHPSIDTRATPIVNSDWTPSECGRGGAAPVARTSRRKNQAVHCRPSWHLTRWALTGEPRKHERTSDANAILVQRG